MTAEPPAQRLTEPVWLPVAVAARKLGNTEQAVRRRIRAGAIDTRREVVGNRSRVLVRVDQPAAEPIADSVALLTQQVRQLEGEVAGLRAERDRLQGELASTAVEAAELRGRIEELRARLTEATRPGPVARLIEVLVTRLTGKGSAGA